MKLTATSTGTLMGRIAMLSVSDAGPSLTFKVSIPVELFDKAATLTVDLRHPQVKNWQGLAGRTYKFDESTQRYGKADGETYAIDDVLGDIRAAKKNYDTYISIVAFGNEEDGRLMVTVSGKFKSVDDSLQPFSVDAVIVIGE